MGYPFCNPVFRLTKSQTTKELFMAKGTDAKKAVKKQPGKTLKEKRKEKRDKKGQRVYEPPD